MRVSKWLVNVALLSGVVTAPSLFAKEQTFQVDTAKTQVEWHGKKVLVDAPHHGTINLKAGEIVYNDKGEPARGLFVIDMTSLKDKDMDVKGKEEYKAKLEAHLHSPDFFDTAKHKEAKLTVNKIEKLADKKYKLSGDLEIKGKSHPVSFDANVDVNGNTLKANAQFTFDRTNYDVRYGSGKFFQGLGDKVIADEVKLEIKDLVATKSEAKKS